MRFFALLCLLLSTFNVETSWAKDKPLWGFCANPGATHECVWNESSHTWTETYVGWDNWEWQATDIAGRTLVHDMHEPKQVPVEREYILTINQATYTKPETANLLLGLVALSTEKRRVEEKRRVVIINVEASQWPEESRVWPHLGINYIGTVAEQEGWEVVLHDELIEGQINLAEVVRSGDIVGLSLVTTGIDRGVELAHEAKTLGASYVIAGNDSAMFRAKQLLELPNKPIDAVFLTNSLPVVREFFRHADSFIAGGQSIRHVATASEQVPLITNEAAGVVVEKKAYRPEDFFLVPNLNLFGSTYWERVHTAYRNQFGHKHTDAASVKNAIALLAQGCGRAGAGNVCDYCTIRHVGNVVLPPPGYLEETLATYRQFGINTLFNVTDSSFEMKALAEQLRDAGGVDSLVMYARSQMMALRPDLIELWKSCVKERVLFNCGMDSGSEHMLQASINKSNSRVGSRLGENYTALKNIKAAGPKVHLHFSVIFGAVGETHESCTDTLGFVEDAADILGEQLDVVEGDVFWVNFGAPCSEIFHSYDAASRRAINAGKAITLEEWQQHFGRHANALSVPNEAQEAWYQFFTHITRADAEAYNAKVRAMMDSVPGRIVGRQFAFRDPLI